MRGTVVCVVSDYEDGRQALGTAVELSKRLGLRLVLAHVSNGIGSLGGDLDGAESVSMKANREGAARLLDSLATEYGVVNRAERRFGTGDAAVVIGQIAAEEAADLIVIAAKKRGVLGRALKSRLAEQLSSETPVPILIAPPRRRAGRMSHERRRALTSS